MAARAATSRVVLDRDGDLTLAVGPDSCEFLVCSRALSRASPVFKAMLNGNHRWQESRPNVGSQLWVVSLPDDSPQSTKILLDIIHGRFAHIPREFAGLEHEHLLHDVLLFADKYDMTKLLQPWAQGWVSALPAFQECSPFWPGLAIATELGLEETVRRFIKRIVMESFCDSKGHLVLEAYGCDVTPGADGIPPAQAELLGKFAKSWTFAYSRKYWYA